MSEEKAEAVLSSPLIELIFLVLVIGFIFAFVVHLVLYSKLKKVSQYISETNRLEIEPLRSFKKLYDSKDETVSVETFVQERISSWRVLGIPVVNLIKLIQMTVSVFILVGVLGTFIGLTISLGSIQSTGEQLVENIAAVLTGIDVAFYTSIAGMGFSLIMTILLKVFNAEHTLTDIMLKIESNLAGSEEHNLGQLITVSENMNQSIINFHKSTEQSFGNLEQAFSGFQEYTVGLQQSAKDLADFNQGLAQNLKDYTVLFNQMKSVTDGFLNGTERLNNNFDSLFNYFSQIEEKNDRIVKTVEVAHDGIKEVSDAQKGTLDRIEHVVSDLKKFTSSLLEGQQSLQDSYGKIMQQSHEIVKKLDKQNTDLKQIFGTDLASKMAGITSYLAQLSRDFDQMGESISDLPEALTIINQTQNEYKHLLSDRFEELKHFNRSFQNHLKEHTTDSLAFERNLREVTKTFEQVGIKNNQLMQEIDKKISQMNQSFLSRENQLDAGVSILKDTLTNYVSNFEGSFTTRLDQVVRSISNSMDQVNENMKREFMEIRRNAEQIQQNNAQYTQRILQELGREMQALIRQMSVVSQQGPTGQPGIGMNRNGY